jgi:hypothetical protein
MIAGMPPLTRILNLRAPESFLLARFLRPSCGDPRYLQPSATQRVCHRFLAKHSGASLTLCIVVAGSESNLHGLLEVPFNQR